MFAKPISIIRGMRECHVVVMVGWMALAACTGTLRASPITVPNASFESPVTTYAFPNVDSWQKADQPASYDTNGFPWVDNIGVFSNTPASSSNHIDNMDGNQAIWLFVVPQVALFQDYDSLAWNDTVPSHAFNATYDPGKSYHLTVGVIGSGGGMLPGASMELDLYYRDAASNMVNVASTPITYTSTIFSNNTHFVDCTVDTPTIKSSDPWAGQHIGIQMLSTVDTNLEGGYWDLDNVRLSSILEPVLSNLVLTNGQFQFTLQSEPGLQVEILSTTNVTLPVSGWTSLGIMTNLTGTISFTDPATNFNARFYAARRLP
jgi:hypothetical protein